MTFKSQELWQLIENGFKETHPEKTNRQLRDNQKKDAEDLFFIQQEADDLIFPKIAVATTSTEAWETLKREYMGLKKVNCCENANSLEKILSFGYAKNEKV